MKRTRLTSKATFYRGPDSKYKLIVFKGIAFVLPLIMLAFVEGGLRFFGYGHDLRLFVEDTQHKNYLVMNRYASKRFFTDSANATKGNFELFRKKKQTGTFRIFVLGESTTIGYPYMHNGSFHRWLQYRLLHTFPDKNFEIINLSLTAVNSYTVLEFGKEIMKYEPDAVLIYSEHNEYYGALGVGSTSSFGSNPYIIKTLLKLRELRLIQLMHNTLYGIKKALSGDKVDVRENLMKRMAADQQIPYGSDAYTRGIRQFETNMNALCQMLSKRKIPVFISNLVSNKKDVKPFISAGGRSSYNAQRRYTQANQAYRKGNYELAKKMYLQAKDFDLLRFRAPEAINGVIKDITMKYPGVYLVDSKALFELHSPHGIIGNSTLLEHVHPNLYGYALLSDAFFKALKGHRMIKNKWTHEMSFAQLRKQMPITQVDSLKGAYDMMLLKKGWPFNEPIPAEFKAGSSTEAEIAAALTTNQLSWNEAMDQLMNYYLKRDNKEEALRVAEAVMLEYPYDATFYVYAGRFSMQLNENSKAAVYLRKAFQLQPVFELARSFFILHLKLDQPEQAVIYLDYAIKNNTSNAGFLVLKATVNKIINLKTTLEANPTNVNVKNQIALNYQKLGNKEVAAKYAGETLQR